MKKILIMVLVLVLAMSTLALTACGGGDKDSDLEGSKITVILPENESDLEGGFTQKLTDSS